MIRRRTALLCAALIASSSAVVAGAGAASAADTAVALPLTNFTGLTTAAGKVYVIGNRTDAVVVRNAAGGAVATVSLNAPPQAITSSADGSRVYVALTSTHTISAIDTANNTVTTSYDTGAGTCPASLAGLGSDILYGSACTTGQGGIGIVDTSTTPAGLTAPTNLGFYYAPALATSAAVPGRVFGASLGLSPSTVQAYDLSGTTFTAGPSQDVGSNLADMAISKDGADLITASGSPYYHPRWKTTDLSADGQYTTSFYPNGVAVAPTGEVAAALNGAASGTDIFIYSGDSETRYYSFNGDANGSDTMAAHGVAFGGSTLYAVTTDVYGGKVELRVLADALKVASALTFAGPSTATRGVTLTLTGQLTSGGHGIAAASVRIARTDLDGTKALPSVTTTSTGSFTVHDAPPAGGTVHYTATFLGDSTRTGSTRTITVAVSRATPYLTITTSHASYHYGDRAYVSAHLGTTYRNRTVALYAHPYGGSLGLLRRANVDSHGNLTVTYTMTRRTTFEAVFGGDERYSSRAVTATRTVSAKISTALRGYYATSGSYHLFHAGTDGAFGAGVTPNKSGQNVYFPLQGYSNGAWHTLINDGFALDSSSFTAVSFHSPKGLSCRLRAVYNGDSANTGAGSGWYYVRFV